MSVFVLDTDVLSLYQHDDPTVAQTIQDHAADQVAITVISVEEQLSGWYRILRKAKKPEKLAVAYDRLARTVTRLAKLAILPYPLPAIRRFEDLRKLKLNVGTLDLRIAAIVLENDATLVTRNEKDFQRVPGLKIENWSK